MTFNELARTRAESLRQAVRDSYEAVIDGVPLSLILRILGVTSWKNGGETLLEGRDVLLLADFIDRPVTLSTDTDAQRVNLANRLRDEATSRLECGIDCGLDDPKAAGVDLRQLAIILGCPPMNPAGSPYVTQTAVRRLADRIDTPVCTYVRRPDDSSHEFAGPVWACSACGHEEGEYGATFYRYCPKCGSKILIRKG